MLEQFGKFDRVLDPGMHFILWPYEREAGRVSIRIRQLDLHCETKSKDHVFVTARLSIQYQAISHHLFESFYSLSSPNDQLTALTLDTLRSKLPQMDLDDIFSSYDDIAIDLHRTLNGAMNKYGFVIHHVLLTQLQPNDHVRHSMNEIQASKRIKEAASHKAEANKVELVKDAEAKAERAYLNGVGIARQRKTLASGMQEVILDAQASNTSVSSKGVMDLLVLTQYIDVITSLNIGGKKDESDGDVHVNSSLILSHMPDIVGQLQDIVRESFASPIEDVKVENLLNTE
jgi:regulator of protease activity HflC (stomatin/prohibitin superfamily)